MFSGIGGAYVMQGMNRGLQDYGNEIRQGTEDRRRRKREDELDAERKEDRGEAAIDRVRRRGYEDFNYGVQQYTFGRQQKGDQRADARIPVEDALFLAGAQDQMGQYAVNPQLRQYSVEAAGLANQQARGAIGLQGIQQRLYGINADRAAAEFNEWGAMAPMRQEAAQLGLDGARLDVNGKRIQNWRSGAELDEYVAGAPARREGMQLALNDARRKDIAGGIQMSEQERAYDLGNKARALDQNLGYAVQTGDFSRLEDWFETAVMDGQTAKIRVEGPPGKSVIRVDVIGQDGKLANSHTFTDVEQMRSAALGYLDPALVPQPQQGRWRATNGQDAVILYDQNTGQAMTAIDPATGQPYKPRQQQMQGFGLGMFPAVPGGQQAQADEFGDLF